MLFPLHYHSSIESANTIAYCELMSRLVRLYHSSVNRMKHRLFLAFPVPGEVAGQIADFQKKLKSSFNQSKIVWIDPATFHVTIHFLGNVDDSLLPEIKRIVELTARRQSAFFYKLNRLEVFPNIFSARVLTVSLLGGGAESQEIHFQLLRCLDQLRIAVNRRPWIPHITLGRIKSRLTRMRLPDIAVPDLTWPVTSLDLMSSDLRTDGPMYTRLQSFSLT